MSMIVFALLVNAIAQVTTFPQPAGIAASDRYAVRVNGDNSFMYHSTSQKGSFDNASWTTFCFSGGPITVEVEKLFGSASSVTVRPLRQNIQATLNGNVATFTLSNPCKLSVEFDDDLVNKCFVFADAPEVNPPKEDDANVIYFGPGVHDIGQDYTIPSGQTMYVAGGAVVKGTIESGGNSNFNILGRGVISSRNVAHVDGAGQLKIRSCNNVTIEGVTLVESNGYIVTAFGSSNMTYKNLKLIGWYTNTDGFHPGRTGTIDDAFIYNSDDAIDIGQNVEDFVVTNVVIWNVWASCLQFSWVATAGSGTRVKGVDIIHYQSPPQAEGGAIWMRHGGSGNLRDFRIEDVVVEHLADNSSKAFLVLEIKDSYYATGPFGSLSDVVFKDITVLGSTSNNRINGMDSQHTISNISFENVTVNGKCANSLSDANMTANQYTSNITFLCNNTPQVFTSVTIDPQRTVTTPGENLQFTAQAMDQSGSSMSSQPSFTWDALGGGTINSDGLFTADAVEGGPFGIVVTATIGGIMLAGTAYVSIAVVTCNDDFNDNSLGPQWSQIDTDNWDGSSVEEKDGWLEITGRGYDFYLSPNYEFVGVKRSDITGDFDLRVRIESQSNTHEWARSGIMVANNVSNLSEGGFCIVAVTPQSGFTFGIDNGSTVGILEEHATAGTASYPCWLRITRSGTSCSAFYRVVETEPWMQIGTIATPQNTGANSEVCLFSTAINASETCTAVFDDFSCGSSATSGQNRFVRNVDNQQLRIVNMALGEKAVRFISEGRYQISITSVDGKTVEDIEGSKHGLCTEPVGISTPGLYLIAVDNGEHQMRTTLPLFRSVK